MDIIGMKSSIISFQDIYKKYANDVFRFAFYLCGNQDDAKDITSETFVRLWTSRNKLIDKTLKAFLFTIARNLFLQRVRNRKPQVDVDSQWIDPTPLPDSAYATRLELKAVLKAMQRLPDVDRMALLMKTQHEFSYSEIAEILNISVAAIKVKIHRARIKLFEFSSLEKENE